MTDDQGIGSVLPLISHTEGREIVGWRGCSPVSAWQFLNDVRSVASQLPASANALNLCHDRYCFTVAFAASALLGQCTLLPGAYAPELIRRLQALTPDLYCQIDGEGTRERLPDLRGPIMR